MDYDYDEYLKIYHNECETDLDFYNFLACTEGWGEEKIKEIMRNISGGDDAYNHAIELSEE